MEIELRSITEDEYEAWRRADARAFGSHVDERDIALGRPSFAPDRSVVAFEGGQIVGGVHSIALQLAVPGGEEMPLAGVGPVSVQPTHRRRGILTRMTAHQLRDIHQRREPLAALFAAESTIYGRFGYGIGTIHESWTIDRPHTAYARPFEPGGRVAFVQPEEIKGFLPNVFRRATAARSGTVQRPDLDWDLIVADPEHRRSGRSAYFHVVYEQQGKVDGYVSYRTRGETMLVQELMAATDEARAALWRFCFDVDLMSVTKADIRPVDDPLPWMLADPRRLKRSPQDGMWLRLVDVPAALSGRRYMQSGRLVLEVLDSFCPWNEGRYELEGGTEGAVCRTSEASPDLLLSAADLASAYLGTVRYTTLSRAGRVEELTSGALKLADSMFATELAPWCPHTF